MQRRLKQKALDRACFGGSRQHAAHTGQIVLQISHRTGSVGRGQPDEIGCAPLLEDVAVGLVCADGESRAPYRVKIRPDQSAVHPQQQVMVVEASLDGAGVADAHPRVHRADTGAGLLGPGRAAPGGRDDELARLHEPAPWILFERGVLRDPERRDRVQRLKMQGADPTDPHRGIRVQMPGHRGGAEDSRVDAHRDR